MTDPKKQASPPFIYQSFIERFKAVVLEQAQKAAIVESGSEAYSYASLWKQASRVALAIASVRSATCPERREVVVGIYIAKSADYVASMLGIWLAGCAFVPLDPLLPADRLAFMCRQAQVAMLITADGRTSFDTTLPLVDFSSLAGRPLGGEDFVPTLAREADLAYVIFTSGSTGQPKGVMVEHRGIVNFIDCQIEAFALTSSSKVLWYLSANFDASVSDLGTALLSGATLFIEKMNCLQPGAGLEEKLVELAITHIDIPPSILRLVSPAKLSPTIETIIIGGEACAPDTVRAYADRLRLVNVYGPTEATVCTSMGRCGPDWSLPLIGQPMANVSYHLLDGQLYIGGVGLARGYAGRDDLTEAKFVQYEGQRLYKTGDLVSLTRDGEYVFQGRSDRQFKLRGMLIEPEEVEAIILQNKAVKRAGVVKRALKPGQENNSARQILTAFIEVNEAQASFRTALIAELRERLSATLPKWMVPQRFEVVAAMPLTVTGKVDLKALESIVLAQAENHASEPVKGEGAALDSAAAILQNIWTDILGVRPSFDDDFFELGGDSFAVVEVVLAAQAHGINLSPALFADATTIGQLEKALNKVEADSMSAEAILADIAFDRTQLDLLAKAAARKPFTATSPDEIFLTGASGFLGARLLQTLLQNTRAKIHCLVRAESEELGLKRIEAVLASQDLIATETEKSRLQIISGTLDQPYFGLETETWNRLSETIDTIFHCGAEVNMFKSYRELRASNVGGTWEIARLMLTGPAKALHYASTLSVFVATDRNEGSLEESDTLKDTRTVYGGYAQSKWAAEMLLRQLDGRAGPITFHRLGLITGDSVGGHSSSHDFLEMFIRGIVQLGCVPPQPPTDQPPLRVDITPADYAASAFSYLALKAMACKRCETYHIANRVSLNLTDLLDYLRRAGCPIDEVSQAEFSRRTLALGTSGRGEVAAAGLALCRLMGREKFIACRSMDLFQATNASFEQANVSRDLEGSGLACPAPTETLIGLYIASALKASRVVTRAAPG